MSRFPPSRAVPWVPVMALVLALAASALRWSPATAMVPVARHAGGDASATAIAISSATFPIGVPVAYVAALGDLPEALPAAAAGGALHGPVLLVKKDNMPAGVGTELSRLHPGRIVVVGDKSHISDAVLTELGSYA